MANKFKSEKYWFRLIKLSPQLLQNFRHKFPSNKFKYEVHEYYENKKQFVVLIPLSLKIPKTELLHFIKRHKIFSLNYGVCVSLSSNRDNDGLRVPKEIADFYKKVGGTFDFSFVCL